MLCRNSLTLVAVLLLGLTGCTWPIAGMRPEAPAVAEQDMPRNPNTYVVVGDLRATAAFAAETQPAQRATYKEEARKSYAKAIEVDPKYLPAHLAMARLQLRCENYPAAREAYVKALELTPKEPSLWYELGLCQCRQKQWADAIGSFGKSLEINPENKNTMLSLGYTLARTGRFPESLAYLTRAEGEAKAHYDLGRMLRHMNQQQAAREHLQAAIRLDANLAGAKELLAALESRQDPALRQTSHTTPAATPPGLPAVTTPATPTPAVISPIGTTSAVPASGWREPPGQLNISGAKEMPAEPVQPGVVQAQLSQSGASPINAGQTTPADTGIVQASAVRMTPPDVGSTPSRSLRLPPPPVIAIKRGN